MQKLKISKSLSSISIHVSLSLYHRRKICKKVKNWDGNRWDSKHQKLLTHHRKSAVINNEKSVCADGVEWKNIIKKEGKSNPLVLPLVSHSLIPNQIIINFSALKLLLMTLIINLYNRILFLFLGSVVENYFVIHRSKHPLIISDWSK